MIIYFIFNKQLGILKLYNDKKDSFLINKTVCGIIIMNEKSLTIFLLNHHI